MRSIGAHLASADMQIHGAAAWASALIETCTAAYHAATHPTTQGRQIGAQLYTAIVDRTAAGEIRRQCAGEIRREKSRIEPANVARQQIGRASCRERVCQYV